MTYTGDAGLFSGGDPDDRSGSPDLVPTPCIGLCILDPESRLCKGCLRTGPEIGAWPVLGSHAKRALLDRLEKRRESPKVQAFIEKWERDAR